MCDAYDMWRAKEIELERRLARCPICCRCGERIQDEEYWDINDNYYHTECAEEEFKKWTEDFTEL